MPTTCAIRFPRLSDNEMRSIDYEVMGHAFAAHCDLGRLCDESVYQRELLRRLQNAGIEARIEIPVTLSHRAFSIRLSLDLVVQQKVIYELKTAAALSSIHEAQLLGYLYLTNSTHGKLVNFRTRSVESRFVNTTFGEADRGRFAYDDSQFKGDSDLKTWISELVKDWGTGLGASLYRRAILHCLSSFSNPGRLLPMSSSGHSIGCQRFHLLDEKTAIGVTTFSQITATNTRDFSKLVSSSPLQRMHWLNIAHHQVTLSTIGVDRNI